MLHDEMADFFFGQNNTARYIFQRTAGCQDPWGQQPARFIYSSDKMSIMTVLDFSGSIAVALDYSLSEEIKMRGLLRTGACQPDHTVWKDQLFFQKGCWGAGFFAEAVMIPGLLRHGAGAPGSFFRKIWHSFPMQSWRHLFFSDAERIIISSEKKEHFFWRNKEALAERTAACRPRPYFANDIVDIFFWRNNEALLL